MPARSRRRVLVIGSGPAGVACAAALADRDRLPIVLDGGRRLEAPRARAIAGLGAAEPADWDAALLEELMSAFPVDAERLPLKPAFGSLFPYVDDEPLAPLRRTGVEAVPSLAVGGLSTVWGAAMLPYGIAEHRGWPFGPEELAPHYRRVLELVPLAGERDGLAAEFPLYVDEPGFLRPTAQVAALLADLHGAEEGLRRAGAVAGRARLAVHTDGAPACRYAGICMLGCPFGSIWSSAQTLEELVRLGRVEHRPGAFAESFEERGDAVRVTVLGSGGREELLADRLFVAAGPLATARLLLASTERFERPLAMRDSAYFTVPLVRHRRPRHAPDDAPGNVLAQAFVELDDPALSRHRVHLQLYGYNRLMLRAAAGRARLPERAAEHLLRPLLGRLIYLQGYLHSDESPGLTVTLVRDRAESVLVAEADAGSSSKPRAVLAKLRSLRRELHVEPLAPMLRIWPVGKGFHLGASVPMRSRPGDLESDLLGRPAGFRRVHLVDASVLPTVPAQTITLPVMANAHRIGSQADED